MDLEKMYLSKLAEIEGMEPANEEVEELKTLDIQSITERLEWIEQVKEMANAEFDHGSDIGKEDWMKGFIFGFAIAIEMINAQNEQDEISETETSEE